MFLIIKFLNFFYLCLEKYESENKVILNKKIKILLSPHILYLSKLNCKHIYSVMFLVLLAYCQIKFISVICCNQNLLTYLTEI